MKTIEITGLAAAISRLKGAQQKLPEALEGALYEEAEQIMTRSKEEFVPVDLGTLRSSGHVTPPERSGDELKVVLAFGGPAAPYALIQHEALHYRHRVGQAKYLETPTLEALPGMADRIARRVRARLS